MPSARVAPRLSKSKLKAVSLLMVVVGLFCVSSAAYPIVSYQLLISPRFSTSIVSPSSEAAAAQSFGSGSFGVAQTSGTDTGVLGTEMDLVDLTKASNWFPTASTDKNFNEEKPAEYSITIPKLGIINANVLIGTDDLKHSLIHYPGTAVPGRYGNAVVFGHSVLPQFFNPKNYMTIFSTLPTLTAGDEIFVNYNQIQYKYVIEHMLEGQPNDISILAQRYDDSYLTLITCVPPGTFLRRLIVRARLAKI